MSYFFSKDKYYLKTGRISCLFCVRITDSPHTSFPLTSVSVPISMYLKYPAPCCHCGSWGWSRCLCVGSWSLWWGVLFFFFAYIFNPLFSIFSHKKYSTQYSVKWSAMTCFGGYVYEKFQFVFHCGSSQSFLAQNLNELGVYGVLPCQLLWWVKLWKRARVLKYL